MRRRITMRLCHGWDNDKIANIFAFRQKGILCIQGLHMIFSGPKGPLLYFMAFDRTFNFNCDITTPNLVIKLRTFLIPARQSFAFNNVSKTYCPSWGKGNNALLPSWSGRVRGQICPHPDQYIWAVKECLTTSTSTPRRSDAVSNRGGDILEKVLDKLET